jgi:hypothetical protein
MKRVLFVRNFRRATGGNVTVRDYFQHALAYRRCSPTILFGPDSRHRESDLWSWLSPGHVAHAPDWSGVDAVVVNGKDWRMLPPSGSFAVVHLVQHLGYARDAELRGYLGRPAARICVSAAVRDAIAPYVNGPCFLVPAGVDFTMFRHDGSRRAGSVLIAASKAPELGAQIAARLRARGAGATVLSAWVPRAEFATMLRAADVFVGLPLAEEGFYRPALEAMACGCAVVCSDALGNRGFCENGETCLQPAHGDAGEHAAAVLVLLADEELRTRIRDAGRARAASFDLVRERARVHAIFDTVFADAGPRA